MEQTIADIVAPNLAISLLGLFDGVGDPCVIERTVEPGIAGPAFMTYTFVMDVTRHGQVKPIELDVRADQDGFVYPGTARCARTGAEFNLDAASIDRILYRRTPRDG